MKQNLQFNFEWLAAANAGDASARAGLAALSITINGRLATELEDLLAKTVRTVARLSAYNLALWLAANWWRLRWEPQRDTMHWKMAHQMGAVGGGYAWPDISFASDGDAVLISGSASPEKTVSLIRYLHAFDETISAAQFEQGIDQLVEAVLERLASFSGTNLVGIDGTLAALWAEVCEERRTPETARWRKLEAQLGYDPGEAPTALIAALHTKAVKLGQGAIEEMACASQSRVIEDLATLQGGQSQAVPATIANYDSLHQQISQLDCFQLPWQRAEQAAALVRTQWGVAAGQPLRNSDLCDLLSLQASAISDTEGATPYPLAAGFRDETAHGSLKVLLTKRRATGRRFELARLVGDDLTNQPTEKLLPATQAKTARQKFQRAFAQELLCPFSELDKFFGSHFASHSTDDDAVEDAASHFQVSPLLVKTTLVNRGRLSRSEMTPSS